MHCDVGPWVQSDVAHAERILVGWYGVDRADGLVHAGDHTIGISGEVVGVHVATNLQSGQRCCGANAKIACAEYGDHLAAVGVQCQRVDTGAPHAHWHCGTNRDIDVVDREAASNVEGTALRYQRGYYSINHLLKLRIYGPLTDVFVVGGTTVAAGITIIAASHCGHC